MRLITSLATLKFLFAIMTVAISTDLVAANQWKLNKQKSEVYFLTVKKNRVGEINRFKSVTGSVDEKGQVEVIIDPKSVETKIPIRNQRMIEHLFEAIKYPRIVIKSQVKPELLSGLSQGDSLTETLDFNLHMHGVKKDLSGVFFIIREKQQMRVFNSVPILISTDPFGMNEGLSKLKDLAKLPSINSVVPVNINLVFEMLEANE